MIRHEQKSNRGKIFWNPSFSGYTLEQGEIFFNGLRYEYGEFDTSMLPGSGGLYLSENGLVTVEDMGHIQLPVLAGPLVWMEGGNVHFVSHVCDE